MDYADACATLKNFLRSIGILVPSLFQISYWGILLCDAFLVGRLANQASARASRERAKDYIKSLESKVEKLSQEVSPTGPIIHVL